MKFAISLFVALIMVITTLICLNQVASADNLFAHGGTDRVSLIANKAKEYQKSYLA
jgi:hypothetical protein